MGDGWGAAGGRGVSEPGEVRHPGSASKQPHVRGGLLPYMPRSLSAARFAFCLARILDAWITKIINSMRVRISYRYLTEISVPSDKSAYISICDESPGGKRGLSAALITDGMPCLSVHLEPLDRYIHRYPFRLCHLNLVLQSEPSHVHGPSLPTSMPYNNRTWDDSRLP